MTQLSALLSQPACRLITLIEIDYNFVEVEEQYLFDIAGKRFIKENGSLKGSLRAFICYEYSESKTPNPAPFIEGIHHHFSIYSYFNQSILKLNQGPKTQKFLFATLKLFEWSFYYIFSLSHLKARLERKPFYVGNFKISSKAPDFLSHLIMSCHSLSHLAIPYPLGWKENHFMLTTLKLVPRFQIFYHILSHLALLITTYHTLSPRLKRKPFYVGYFKISSQTRDFLSHLIMFCHSLSHLITSYPLGWKQNHFIMATLKLVPRLLIFYHILSRLVTPHHILSHLIP